MQIITSDTAMAPEMQYVNTLGDVLESQIEVSAIDKILEMLGEKK